MVILMDVDEPIFMLTKRWVALYNQDSGDNLNWRDVVRWPIEEFVRPDYMVRIFDYLKKPELYEGIEVTPGAQEGIELIRSAGHRIVYTTAGLSPTKFDELIRRGFLPSDRSKAEKDYIVSRDKNLIRGDLLVDDGFHNVVSFPGRAILFDAPHNAQETWKDRAIGWDGVLQLLGLKDKITH